jgi:hypothetical protein
MEFDDQIPASAGRLKNLFPVAIPLMFHYALRLAIWKGVAFA